MGTPAHPMTVVVGYDGSDTARLALRTAARQAGEGGRVFVVYAYELPPEMLGSPYYNDALSAHRDRGRALLDELPLDREELAGPTYELELIGGPPAQAIADVARARDADQIVVGARGMGRMRALLGSVSHELLHVADRPVLVIPAAASGTEQQ